MSFAIIVYRCRNLGRATAAAATSVNVARTKQSLIVLLNSTDCIWHETSTVSLCIPQQAWWRDDHLCVSNSFIIKLWNRKKHKKIMGGRKTNWNPHWTAFLDILLIILFIFFYSFERTIKMMSDGFGRFIFELRFYVLAKERHTPNRNTYTHSEIQPTVCQQSFTMFDLMKNHFAKVNIFEINPKIIRKPFCIH